ncbi:hypothetical protein Avbf_13877 [Armadillidium vulgare]|nr:hypothetical protein Avbf_13877 [Armadillidium vulgare]
MLVKKVFGKMSVEKIIKSPGVPLTVPEGSFLKTLFKDANKWMTKHAISVTWHLIVNQNI